MSLKRGIMKTSKIISLIIFLTIILILASSAIYKVYTDHKDDLLKVINQRIEEAGEKCILDDTCTENTITLDFLIQNEYLEEQIHPISKEYISHDTVITCENYNCISSIN